MIQNQNLHEQTNDETIVNLYHLNIFQDANALRNEFGDVKMVCMGGKVSRMRELAKLWKENKVGKTDGTVHDYSGAGDRFSMFKENRVLFLSHGMGIPSILIALHEVTKLLHFAGVTDAIFIRMGTCGGLDLEPGTFVVTEKSYDGKFNNHLEMYVCGKEIRRSAILDQNLMDEFVNISEDYFRNNEIKKIIKANTLCTNDFYEEQARMDGAFNDITDAERINYLRTLMNKYNIRNIEMESLGFAAFCHNLKIKGIVVTVTLVDRIISDEISLTHETMDHHQDMMNKMLINFFNRKLDT